MPKPGSLVEKYFVALSNPIFPLPVILPILIVLIPPPRAVTPFFSFLIKGLAVPILLEPALRQGIQTCKLLSISLSF